MIEKSDWLKTPIDLAGKKIWIAGHNGMVGAALCRVLEKERCHILKVSRAELDLRHQAAVNAFYSAHKPDFVILAAAKVGGIVANAAYPAQFLYDNMMIEANVIHGAYESGVSRLLFLGSSCIYPRDCPQPMKEEYLLTGPLEPTNESYAIAKIAGLKLAQAYRKQYGCDFISAMPCNLLGIGDRYDEHNSHVVPALIMRAHAAKIGKAPSLCIWGSGEVLREFMDVDDLSSILLEILKYYCGNLPLNVGSGYEISIGDIAEIICEVTDFKGNITFDTQKPDGPRRKVLDSSRLSGLISPNKLCQKYDAKAAIKDSIQKCYDDYLKGVSSWDGCET